MGPASASTGTSWRFLPTGGEASSAAGRTAQVVRKGGRWAAMKRGALNSKVMGWIAKKLPGLHPYAAIAITKAEIVLTFIAAATLILGGAYIAFGDAPSRGEAPSLEIQYAAESGLLDRAGNYLLPGKAGIKDQRKLSDLMNKLSETLSPSKKDGRKAAYDKLESFLNELKEKSAQPQVKALAPSNLRFNFEVDGEPITIRANWELIVSPVAQKPSAGGVRWEEAISLAGGPVIQPPSEEESKKPAAGKEAAKAPTTTAFIPKTEDVVPIKVGEKVTMPEEDVPTIGIAARIGRIATKAIRNVGSNVMGAVGNAARYLGTLFGRDVGEVSYQVTPPTIGGEGQAVPAGAGLGEEIPLKEEDEEEGAEDVGGGSGSGAASQGPSGQGPSKKEVPAGLCSKDLTKGICVITPLQGAKFAAYPAEGIELYIIGGSDDCRYSTDNEYFPYTKGKKFLSSNQDKDFEKYWHHKTLVHDFPVGEVIVYYQCKIVIETKDEDGTTVEETVKSRATQQFTIESDRKVSEQQWVQEELEQPSPVVIRAFDDIFEEIQIGTRKGEAKVGAGILAILLGLLSAWMVIQINKNGLTLKEIWPFHKKNAN